MFLRINLYYRNEAWHPILFFDVFIILLVNHDFISGLSSNITEWKHSKEAKIAAQRRNELEHLLKLEREKNRSVCRVFLLSVYSFI